MLDTQKPIPPGVRYKVHTVSRKDYNFIKRAHPDSVFSREENGKYYISTPPGLTPQVERYLDSQKKTQK